MRGSLLPSHTLLSVNFPALSADPGCFDSVEWILTRAFKARAGWSGEDVKVCNNGGRLPTEDSVLNVGIPSAESLVQRRCLATVTVLDARTKTDAGKDVQNTMMDTLTEGGLVFGCFP